MKAPREKKETIESPGEEVGVACSVGSQRRPGVMVEMAPAEPPLAFRVQQNHVAAMARTRCNVAARRWEGVAVKYSAGAWAGRYIKYSRGGEAG